MGLRYDLLTDLSITGHCLSGRKAYTDLVSCLAMHAPQLERLSLAFHALGEDQSVISALSTPMLRLTHLGLESSSVSNSSAIASIFARHPKLNSISLGLGGDIPGLCLIVSHARSMLTSLKIFQLPD